MTYLLQREPGCRSISSGFTVASESSAVKSSYLACIFCTTASIWVANLKGRHDTGGPHCKLVLQLDLFSFRRSPNQKKGFGPRKLLSRSFIHNLEANQKMSHIILFHFWAIISAKRRKARRRIHGLKPLLTVSSQCVESPQE